VISFAGVGLIGYASFVPMQENTVQPLQQLSEHAIYIGVGCGLLAAIFLSLHQVLTSMRKKESLTN
jgi:drug/metabolite transporter (DMT)-like permease